MVNFDEWCNKLKEYWINKDIDNVLTLFESDVEYYETPMQRVNGLEEVRSMWNEIKEQNIKSLEYKIICKDGNKCIANYILRDDYIYDMVYEIILNERNKCTYFKMWFMRFENENN